MIDIDSYRQQIGYFNQTQSRRKIKMQYRNREAYLELGKRFLRVRKLIQILLVNIIVKWVVAEILQNGQEKLKNIYPCETNGLPNVQNVQKFYKASRKDLHNIAIFQFEKQTSQEFSPLSMGIYSSNFYARLTYGNKASELKGIKNIHLNIRSLSNKISEVKHIINQEKPHIFGISECELRKSQNKSEETRLKIPGYDLVFPKSWSIFGYARVILYVKTTLQYEEIHDLEDEKVQSVWIKAGFRGSKKIHFCHFYREHTNTLGASLKCQREHLELFMKQWESASEIRVGNEPAEIHIVGDMNLDALNGKWFSSSYHLFSLARIVHDACRLGNFYQLVHHQPGISIIL